MSDTNLNLWVIPLLPLAGAAMNGLLGRRFKNGMVSFVALLSTGLSFGWALRAVWVAWPGGHVQLPYIENHGDWIWTSVFSAPFGFYLDQLSIVMLMVVTGVGFLIHVYSVGYMGHEGGYYRFFSYLNLFMFFMLMLVLADNYLLLFVGWEGVGLASYLLIGFYFLRDSAADAGKKAFIVNRIGDFAFLIGMFLLIQHFGTLNFDGKEGVFSKVSALGFDGGWGWLTITALCLMFGAMGKSAQVPLYVWLPDAMEGPTPVSALIHAATMVTAGIYMIARSSAIFSRAPHAMFVVAVIGCFTALLAATIGMAQTDIKRVLAYSTVSQLGYMFMACGVAAYSAGIFHLMTHAFFKALLFLAAGSVIHALGGEQDMRRMGGLRKLIPWTFWTMTIATFAISGIPGLAGFFSKDEILARDYAYPFGGHVLWTVAVITAGLTSFYMFRLWFMTFFGEPRWNAHRGDAHGAQPPGSPDRAAFARAGVEVPSAASLAATSTSHGDHGHGVHESPWVMIAPLVVLAIGSIVSGWAGIPQFLGGHDAIDNFLKPAIQTPAEVAVSRVAQAPGSPDRAAFARAGVEAPSAVSPLAEEQAESASVEWGLAVTSIAVAGVGLFFAWLLYYKKRDLPDRITVKIQGVYLAVLHKYYVDEAYGALFVKPLLALSTYVLWRGIDQNVIDGLVNGAGETSQGIGNQLRRMQSGNIRSYAAWVAAGGAVVIVYMLWHNLAGVSK